MIAEATRQPDPWELHYLLLALDHLKTRNCADGERALTWGETAPAGQSAVMATKLPTHKPQTMAELRARLETILSEDA